MEKYQALIGFIRKSFSSTEEFISLHEPRFIGNERKYVMNAIDSTFVSSVGEYVNRFEEMICSLTGAKYAVATTNGTAALHMCLLLAGVQQEDEVITQSLSFIATSNAISYCGAKPVFLDVDRDTMGLSVKSVKTFLENQTLQKGDLCINKRTGKVVRAVVPMHTFGHPIRIDELVSLCNRHNIVVVEDAAESIGSYYKGKHTGTFGQSAAFSFNGNKTLTCGGGGVIITNDQSLANKAKHWTTTAKISHPWEYTHDAIGYNYRMPNLNAAMACAQLEQLPMFLENKRQLAKDYIAFGLKNDLNIVLEPSNAISNYWLNALCLSDRDERDLFLAKLNEAGVMCRPIWTLLHKMFMFSGCYVDEQTNAQWLEDRIVNVPSSVKI
ncbi:LegC family aminotransferase [Reichenbachiella carrageenanivorans]|uniref:LegC family aminotransferase n=1 Tax=Reichenbachiella carrageenanivorans TaxID=2979869 RepID=A0ABY6D370_9BACT|nr:LegC family aminotransferase [Reichenbachiella carrageenanivorans]UXX80607.1 LegC family aminotransferase [Reichenbachiella carrageenanivorans]